MSGAEICIVQTGVPCGLIQNRTEPGYVLADGTVLLESERDANSCYKGGAGMDGMYLQTGRLYAPVRGDDGQIRAFREVKPENYLAAAEMSAESSRNQMDGLIRSEAPRPSVLDSLRQCRGDAEKSQGGTAPPGPSRDPEW